MTIANNFRAVLVIGALLGALFGCDQQGTMEKAGESVDEALEKSADKIKKVGDDIQDAVEDDSE